VQIKPKPFIKILSRRDSDYSGAEDAWHEDFCYAAFAALIKVKTAEENKDLRWGFNMGALLAEAIDRQRLFIETQHYPYELGYLENQKLQTPPQRRAFSIRCTNSPGTNQLQLAVIGRVTGMDQEEAKKLAFEYWLEISSTFPTDYTLSPATDETSFEKLCGWDILENADRKGQIAEITRYENYFNNQYYLLGSWNTSSTANEQIWRTLANAVQEVIYDISICPTILTYEDLQIAYRQLEYSEKELEGTEKKYSAWIAHGKENWQKFVDELQHPYLVQIRLASKKELPEYLARSIGFAHAHSDEAKPVMASFSVCQPETEKESRNWLHQLQWLVIETPAREKTPPEVHRLRKMVSTQDAMNLFRLPYPSVGGIPGVKFVTSIEDNEGE